MVIGEKGARMVAHASENVRSPRSVSVLQLLQHVARRRPIPVSLADLAVEDDVVPIDQKCGRICRLIRSVPAQSVSVGELVVWIDHKDYVRRQGVFLGEELLCTLVEFCWRSRIDEQNLSSRRSKLI